MTNNCSLCSKLKDKEYSFQKFGGENNTYLPQEAAKLETIINLQPTSERKKLLQQCPECKTYFLYETDYEYLVNGTEDEEFLTRLTEKEASQYLRA